MSIRIQTNDGPRDLATVPVGGGEALMFTTSLVDLTYITVMTLMGPVQMAMKELEDGSLMQVAVIDLPGLYSGPDDPDETTFGNASVGSIYLNLTTYDLFRKE